MVPVEHFHVVWRVYPHHDLIQMSGILSGLAILARRGMISLSFELMNSVVQVPYSLMELVITQASSGRKKNVVLDFYDREDRIIPSALQFSDIYFKRQFGPASRAAAHGKSPEKIVPLGLTIAGYSRESWRMVVAAIRASLQSREVRSARPGLSAAFRQAYADARLWYTLPPPDAAVTRDTDVKETHIVFQPRLWPTTRGSGDVFDVANEDRILTVRALRRDFPAERAIGLLHTPTASEQASELLLDHNVGTAEYHRQLRASLVAVNCVGLSGSVGWKFAEYLAAGNAVVSQPIEKEVLAPIEPDVHYLAYHSPEECVALCHRLLADRALAARMGAVNHEYFQRWVNPPAHVTHLLKRAFA